MVDSGRRQWQPTPVLLPGKSHGWRSLVGCCPWGREESDITEWLHFHFSLPCIGEGNGNPLQCSRLENPRDRGAWWVALCGIAQSQTQLKWLSSSSSRWIHVFTGDHPNLRQERLWKTLWHAQTKLNLGVTTITIHMTDVGHPAFWVYSACTLTLFKQSILKGNKIHVGLNISQWNQRGL